MGLLSILLFILAVSATSFNDHQVFRFAVKSKQDYELVEFVRQNYELDVWSESAFQHIDVRLPPSTKSEILDILGSLEHSVIVENVQDLIDQEKKHSAAARVMNGRLGSASSPAEKIFSDYQDAQTYLDFLLSFPGTKKVKIGTSFEGRAIEGVKFGSGSLNIVFHGAIHAREHITPAVSTFIAHQLLTSANTTKLLNKYTFTVVPVLNVDGYAFTRKAGGNRLWRKNRQVFNTTTCIGIDNNRNFAYKWDASGASGSPCAEIYRGPTPFAAPETKAIADYISSLNNVVSYIDFHAYSQLWMFPWGYTCQEKVPDWNLLNDASAKSVKSLKALYQTNFRYGDICNVIYAASGSSVDWAYGVANVKFSFGIELRDTGKYGFLLPANQIVPTGEETFAGVFTLWNYLADHLDGTLDKVEEPVKKVCPWPACWKDSTCTDCCYFNCA